MVEASCIASNQRFISRLLTRLQPKICIVLSTVVSLVVFIRCAKERIDWAAKELADDLAPVLEIPTKISLVGCAYHRCRCCSRREVFGGYSIE